MEVMNNRNSSPVHNINNEMLNKVFIIYTSQFNSIDDIENIGAYLEQEGLISGFNLDRIDNKNTNQEHYNFYFNSNINNNALNKFFKDYIDNNEIDLKLIEKYKEEIQMSKEYKIKGVAEYSETNRKSFLDIGDEFKDLLNIKENNDLKFIGMDTLGQTTIKDITSNLGKGRDTIPERLSFSVVFDKDLEDIEEDELKETLEKSFDYFDKDTSLLKPYFDINGNIMNVEMNNVLKNKNANEFYLMGAKQYRKRMEAFLSSVIENNGLSLTTNKYNFETKNENIQELFKKQDKTLNDEIKEIRKNEVNQVEKVGVKETKELKNINVDFVSDLEKIKVVEDFGKVKEQLEKDLEAIQLAKKFIPNFNEVEKELKDKIELVEIKKDELIKNNEKDFKIETLENDLNLTTKELNGTKEELKVKEVELDKAIEVIEDFKVKNSELNKELIQEQERHLATQKEKVEYFNQVQTMGTTIETLNEKLSEYRETNQEFLRQIEQANITIKELSNSLNEANEINKIQNEKLSEYRETSKEFLKQIEEANITINDLRKSLNEVEKPKINFNNDVAKEQLEKIANYVNDEKFDTFVKNKIEIEKLDFIQTLNEVENKLDIKRDDNNNIVSVKNKKENLTNDENNIDR